MKNAINYYYNINAENIHQNNKNYRFKVNNDNYFFSLYNEDINKIKEIYSIHLYLLQRGLYCHQIILNINNEPLTLIEGKYYILLKIGIYNRKIEFNDIIYFSQQYVIYNNFITDGYDGKKRKNVKNLNNYNYNDWFQLWTAKTDYVEYQVSQFGIKYPIISQSVSYYIGMAETAISYLKNSNIKNVTYSISHRRIKNNSTLFDLYNPVNFIISLSVRDICEYLKDSYFEKNIDVLENIRHLNINRDDILALISRMLYPTYYFDHVEMCIDNKKDEKNILKYINKANEFQKELKKIILYYKNVYNIDTIEWIIKT